MIRLDMEQGSAEWVMARIGIPTASSFDKIITNKTAKLSESAAGYAHKLIAEKLLGISLDEATSSFMERGAVMEQAAVAWYELQRDCDTEKVGFCLRDDGRAGCSPDRLVGGDGLLEIKCPSAHVHVGYLLDDAGIGYRAQCQGQLWITGRRWIDTLSYHPQLPKALVRVERDEDYIGKLAAAVEQFLSFRDECLLKLARLGHIPQPDVPALKLA